MKILRLEFENVNSLAGVWKIDFTAPAFADGLFLITGETGSGKTTILDAISLALYGRTVRENVSGAANETMTRGTGHSRAEVEFSCASGRYRAIWEQRRAYSRSTGGLQGVRVMLQDCASDKFLAEGTVSETKDKIRELVGLSFSQFQRTMMLAQGRFDQFLTADESERAEILQQATGMDVYERIGRRIFERRKEAESAVDELVTRIGEIILLEPEALAAKKSERRVAHERSRVAAKELEAAQKLLGACKKAEGDFTAASANLARREKDVASCTAKLDKAQSALSIAGEALKKAEQNFAASEPLIKRAAEISAKIALAKKDASARDAALAKISASLKAERTSETAAQKKNARLAQVSAAVVDALEKRVFCAPPDRTAAKDKAVKLAERFITLAKADEGESVVRQALADAADRAANECSAAEKDYAEKHPLLVTNLENAQRAYEAALAYASLDDWRMKLEKNAPCPLCGSTLHPFAEHAAVPQKSVCELALDKAKLAVAELDKNRDHARRRRDAALDALSAHDRERADARRQFEETQRSLGEMRSALSASITANDEALQAAHSRILRLEADEKDAAASLASANDHAASLQTQYDALGLAAPPETLRKKLQATLDSARKTSADATAALEVAKAKLAAAKKELENAAKAKTVSENALAAAMTACPDAAALEEKIRVLKTEKTECDSRIGALDAEIAHDAAARSRRADYDAQLTDARRRHSLWKNLDGWLGGATGERFKRFAHGITLRQLVDFANPHLARMTNGRYVMEWIPEGATGGAKLLPSLIDNEQGGEKRPVSNLSGGERFQTSLALALGLSEISSNRLSIDTLFLDEGFGTLDERTLETALDALCAVQQNGKMIGVISHVAAVAERLTTQIHVEKAGNGRSTLSGAGIKR